MNFQTIESSRQSIRLLRKTERYELCLSFIKGILEDFGVKTDQRHRDFLTGLGNVASCIDAALDELGQHNKDKLYWNFSAFYYKLQHTSSVSAFGVYCEQFMDELDIHLNTALNYPLLYDLVHDARQLGIDKELNAFALQTIHAAIKKQHATDIYQIHDAIKTEGKVAVDFLLLYLEHRGLLAGNKSRKGLRNYLISLERILNLADDIVDSKKDKRLGVIGIQTGPGYYLINAGNLFGQLCRAFIFQPRLFSRHCMQFTYRYFRLEMALAGAAK